MLNNEWILSCFLVAIALAVTAAACRLNASTTNWAEVVRNVFPGIAWGAIPMIAAHNGDLLGWPTRATRGSPRGRTVMERFLVAKDDAVSCLSATQQRTQRLAADGWDMGKVQNEVYGQKFDERPKLCDKVIALAEENGLKLYRDSSEQTYASYSIDGHTETWRLMSPRFEQWLRFIYYSDTGKAVSREAINDSIATLDARARYEGEEVSLSLRVARRGQEIWFDLCDESWRVVRVSPSIKPYGWEIVGATNPIFRRDEDMLAVLDPKHDEEADAFWALVNLPKDKDERLLLQCHIISFLIPNIPHPILELYGRKGAAKTDLAEKVKQLIDPSHVLKFTLEDPRNVNNILDQHYIVVLDNVSRISRSLADKLCRAVDGESSSERRLGTNRGQERYKYQSCLIITCIEAVGSEYTDMAQRTNLYQPPYIDKKERRTEEDLDRGFEACRAATLGYFFTIVAKAIDEHHRMAIEKMGVLPRLADFCTWGEAISRAMGNAPGRFWDAYFKNINLGVEESISSNALAQAIIRLLDGTEGVGGFAATPDTMLMKLTEMAASYQIPVKGDDWPKAANKLSDKIANIVEDLREVGILFEKKKANELGQDGEKLLCLSTNQTVAKGKVAKPKEEVQRGQTILIFRQERKSVDATQANDGSTVATDTMALENHNTEASIPGDGEVLRCYDAPPSGDGGEGLEELLLGIASTNRRVAYFVQLDPKNRQRLDLLIKMGRITESADGYLSPR